MAFKKGVCAGFLLGVLGIMGGSAIAEVDVAGNDSKLALVETSYDKMAEAKSSDEKDKYAGAFEDSMMDYAKSMMASYDDAFKTATAQGATPKDSRDLKVFEEMAKRHEHRTSALARRASKVKPPDQKGGSLDVPGGKVQFGELIFRDLHDLFFSPAEGAIAYMVWAPCHTNPVTQPACTNAVLAAPGQTSSAWSTFNSCWSSYEHTRPLWWRATLRSTCLAALVIRLA